MDGVIFEGRNFWLDLHRAMGTEREAWSLWEKYALTDYAKLAAITVEEVWSGRDADPMFSLIAARPYVDGIREVFEWLKLRGFLTGIVSTGPYQLAERAQRELGVDKIMANLVHIDGNRFSGKVDLLVDENGKDRAALKIIRSLGRQNSEVAAIGDTRSDIKLFRIAQLAIAYDPDDEALVDIADTVIRRGEMRSLVPRLENWTAPEVGDG